MPFLPSNVLSPTFPSSLACQDPQGHQVLRAPQVPLSHLKFC